MPGMRWPKIRPVVTLRYAYPPDTATKIGRSGGNSAGSYVPNRMPPRRNPFSNGPGLPCHSISQDQKGVTTSGITSPKLARE